MRNYNLLYSRGDSDEENLVQNPLAICRPKQEFVTCRTGPAIHFLSPRPETEDSGPQ